MHSWLSVNIRFSVQKKINAVIIYIRKYIFNKLVIQRVTHTRTQAHTNTHARAYHEQACISQADNTTRSMYPGTEHIEPMHRMVKYGHIETGDPEHVGNTSTCVIESQGFLVQNLPAAHTHME